jgi:two-component system sensor histidine kinase GlrK
MMPVIRSVRPRSFLTLVLVGFLAVALPLLAAILFASLQVERLARQSEDAVYRTVQLTHGGRNLVDELTAMERNVRQYLVLKDESRLAAYDKTHAELQGTVSYMLALEDDAGARHRLQELAERERRLYETLRGQELDPSQSEAAVGEFVPLAELARRILAEANAGVGHGVEVLREMAGQAQQFLVWQAIGVLPLVVALAGLFLFLIGRPLTQLDHAIRLLGDGELYAPVQVRGPQDLETLGERLEWLRTRLLELEEEKKSFLRHVSHELKTPLTALREGAELLAEQVVGPLNEQQREVTEILHNNALRLQKLIEDLLAFSRLPEVRSAEVRREPVRLDQLARSVVTDHRVGALARGLRFRLSVEPITLQGDRARLRALLDNLVSNAVKYSPKGGRIDIRLLEDQDGVSLEVQDQGPGIPMADRSRVFDPFYQGRNQPGGPVQGTGLGLAIARECAIAHGGEIRIIDDSGPGTHFRVTLPSALVTARAP